EEAGLAPEIERARYPRDIERRDGAEAEGGVIDLRLFTSVNDNALRRQAPHGVRHFANGDVALVNDVTIGAGLFDELAAEDEVIWRGERHAAAVQAHAGGAGHVIEAAGLALKVVERVRGGDVLIVRAAGNVNVAGSGDFTGALVVGHLISLEGDAAVADLGVAVEGVPVASLLHAIGFYVGGFAAGSGGGG